MRDHDYWVYIVTNKTNSTLYIGMTNDLERRMAEHRSGEVKGFTQRYSLNRLRTRRSRPHPAARGIRDRDAR